MCQLFTHSIYYRDFAEEIVYDDYVETGPERFDRLVNGGEVFNWLLTVKHNVFMTHQQNYCGDRLALKMFDGIFDRLRKWTTLEIRQIGAVELAGSYFSTYPNEIRVKWTNPCDDSRHIDPHRRLKVSDKCQKAPKFVVVGPEEGSTLQLVHYLNMHMNLNPVKVRLFC